MRIYAFDARARTYASHACAAGAKKREKNTWRERGTEIGRRYRETGTRKGDREGGRGADAGQTATARGWGWMQRGGWKNVFPESLVKWKSITSTLNHLNWFRHGPKARSALLSLFLSLFLSLLLIHRVEMSNAHGWMHEKERTRGRGRKRRGQNEGRKVSMRKKGKKREKERKEM